jgi:hypothetical protein
MLKDIRIPELLIKYKHELLDNSNKNKKTNINDDKFDYDDDSDNDDNMDDDNSDDGWTQVNKGWRKNKAVEQPINKLNIDKEIEELVKEKEDTNNDLEEPIIETIPLKIETSNTKDEKTIDIKEKIVEEEKTKIIDNQDIIQNTDTNVIKEEKIILARINEISLFINKKSISSDDIKINDKLRSYRKLFQSVNIYKKKLEACNDAADGVSIVQMFKF